MSALGQKQTCAVQKGMSALGQKRTFQHIRDVRFTLARAGHKCAKDQHRTRFVTARVLRCVQKFCAVLMRCIMRPVRSVQLSLMLACLVITNCPRPTIAQIARTEVHLIQTTTPTDQQFLSGAKDAKAATIAGVLRIPRLGTDRLPAVILVHGSGGIGGNVDRWSQELNSIGLATFVTDSFTARGIQSTSANQVLLGRLNMILDSYRALGVLAAHPRIDPGKIVLMGFSRGGQATLYASLKRFERMYGPEGATFAAYVPFYAPCFTTYIGDEDVSDKPIRLFHGTADDYVPVAPCRAYVERLRKAGKDVMLTEYPDT